MSISMNMTGTWRRHLARVSAPLRAPAPPPLPSTPLSCPRPVIRGKFLLAGEQKLYVRGVTYGAFRPDAEGNEYHDLDTIEQAWFRDVRFRQAVSAAIDRAGIVRLAHHGRAVPLASHVSPGNRPRINAALKPPARSLGRARELLAAARFSWKADGTLVDPAGQAVEFSIITNVANSSRVQAATIIQDDLRQLGMRIAVVPLENRALIGRVLQSHDYDAAVMALGSGDADPNPEMSVLLSSGKTHLWRLAQSRPPEPWQAEIDRLIRRQLVTLDQAERKRLYDRVQELVAENLPIVPLVSPNILVGVKDGLVNFRPAVLDHYTLWNADELFWRSRAAARRP
jgi:peptide/nickel transport system substrate-binding protein